jgi:hypothetical protein
MQITNLNLRKIMNKNIFEVMVNLEHKLNIQIIIQNIKNN